LETITFPFFILIYWEDHPILHLKCSPIIQPSSQSSHSIFLIPVFRSSLIISPKAIWYGPWFGENYYKKRLPIFSLIWLSI
jgi:hypothetical protein